MTPKLNTVLSIISRHNWFTHYGAYVIVDGQYGSTGKGALATLLALAGMGRITIATTSAGPNSGHTGHVPHWGHIPGRKIVTRQLPIVSAVLNHIGGATPVAYLNGGAVIDPGVLFDECAELEFPQHKLQVHPCAAIIMEEDRQAEAEGSVAAIASTGKGVGSALARKILRKGNIAKQVFMGCFPVQYNWDTDIVVVEVAQGFSLGINSSRFYPYVTSRECTVMQGIADAQIPYNKVRKVAMAVRAYPIRVGNTDKGQSGDCYPDQEETSWETLGVEPELTTVTQRVRRVFTWSRMQFQDAVRANQPDTIFVSHCDYIKSDEDRAQFLNMIINDYTIVMDCRPMVLYSKGPTPEDVFIWST